MAVTPVRMSSPRMMVVNRPLRRPLSNRVGLTNRNYADFYPLLARSRRGTSCWTAVVMNGCVANNAIVAGRMNRIAAERRRRAQTGCLLVFSDRINQPFVRTTCVSVLMQVGN